MKMWREHHICCTIDKQLINDHCFNHHLKMKALRDLDIFVRAAEQSSLTAAAHQLDLTPAAASAAVKRLERELGCALMLRSTRSLRLTAEGELLLNRGRQALELLDEAHEAIASGRSTIRGPLQLSLPSDLGRNCVLAWLDAFTQRHPKVQLRIQLSDRVSDLYRHPIDLALRYGAPPDSSLVALPIAPTNRRMLCAAPAYLQRHGEPANPAELAAHNCLCFALGDQMHDRWRFWRNGQESSIAVSGDRSADDGDAVRRWAVAGHGIAYKSELDIRPDLDAGRLVELCTDWVGELAPLNLMCADRRQLSASVQALRAFLQDCIQGSSST